MKDSSKQNAMISEAMAGAMENARARSFSVARQVIVAVTVVLLSLITLLVSTG